MNRFAAAFSIAALTFAAGACGGATQQTRLEVDEPKTAEPIPVDPAAMPELPQIDVPFEKFVLPNGLTVIVHEDHKAPVVAVNVWYRVGSKDEKVGKTGFAHLFEHLMFQGSENFQGEFFEPLEKAGATDMNGTTNEDRTNYFQTVPTPALDLALWMESDRMGHFSGAISQARLDEQRGVVQNEKRQGQNRPYGKAWEQISPNTFPVGHPYSWTVIGSMDDLNAASLDDVKAWFAEYYGASNAVVAIAGDITPAEARKKVEQFFGDIPAGPAVAKRGPWVPRLQTSKRMTLYDRVPQERVYIVYNVPEYGNPATERLRLASQVLGKGKNSRLHKRLVYEEQLATSAKVWLSDGMLASQIIFIADARPGVPIAKVEAALSEEILKFVEDGPAAEEVGRAKMRTVSSRVSRLERVGGFGGKSDLLAESEVYLGDPGAYAELHRTFATSTPEDVRAAAAEWLSGGRFIMHILPEAERTVSAKGADRKQVPAAGPVPELKLPKLQRTKLSNGLEVVLAERHDVPTVRVKLRTELGYADDRGGKLGTAKLAMDVLDEGTAKRSSLELAAELERLGASISAGAGLDASSVSMTTLKTSLGAALDLFAEVIKEPAFAPEELERRRKQLLAGIEKEKSQPFQTALRLLGPLVFGAGHAYGMPMTGSGTTESVTSISRDDLVGFHKAAFSPEVVTLVVVGDTTLEEMTPLLEARFGAWTTAGAAPKSSPNVLPTRNAAEVYLIDKPRAEQSLIVAGNPFAKRDEKDAIAISAMNAIVGGTFMSRINMNLREDKHWSYGSRSFVYETDNEQLFGAYGRVQSDKTAESIVEIKKELDEYLGKRPATEDELSRTKNNKTRKLPGQNETSARVMNSISTIIRFGLPDDYYDTYVGRVQALTTGDMAAAAKKVIQPDKLVWIVIGDLSKIEAKVRALKLGKVTVVDVDGKPVK